VQTLTDDAAPLVEGACDAGMMGCCGAGIPGMLGCWGCWDVLPSLASCLMDANLRACLDDVMVM
jgi:hypothetical protein